MASTNDRYAALLSKLHEATLQKRISWNIDDFSEEIETTVGKNRLGMSVMDKGNAKSVRVRVYSEDGSVIDSFDDDDFGTASAPTGYTSYWFFMNEMIRAAKRSASGADKVIDDLISELDNGIL